MTRYRDIRVGGCLQAALERRPDGVVVLRSTEPLQAYPRTLVERLEQWAREAPERVFVARRDRGGPWRTITYAQMLARAQAVGQALAQRPLSAERPVAILSDNDLEHLTLALGAMWVGVPCAPVSPAYSLLSQD
ncbi:MAG TPA: AMP-binding protein, partial [Albitalea sp.]